MAKAGKTKFKLNKKAMAELMHAVKPDLQEHANAVADSARSKLPPEVPVGTRAQTNDEGRPVVLVTVMHPSGAARQAKDGVLTRAAADNRLEVTRYPERG